MNKDIAIQVKNISKTFKIPHEKINSLRGAFVSALKEKTYEEFKALDDVSFEVKKGEFFGIIGRNGSGKSTLLKILAGIYQADSGKIKINGMISPFLELGIGFNLELSGRDNIYLNATVLGMTKKQIDEKFDDIVAFSELERFIDQKLKNYSSGMQVRLAFSVAIHANRDILLMDEVLAVGDSNFQQKCLEEFNKYRELGKTVILVTHDISTIQRYCDRAMLLRNGKIEMIGDSEKVGNEYIYQNMSDEEKRIFDEERRKAKALEKIAGKEKRKDEKSEETKDAETQNLAPEEKEKPKKKIAEITGVEFLDKNGKARNVFRTGDDISIRVYFKQNKKVDVLNFGLAIFDQENKYIFGINTFLDKINTKKYIEKGFFEVFYRNIRLGENNYFIKAGIWGDSSIRIIDFLDKSARFFRVLKTNNNEGLFHLDYKWL